MRVAVTGATGLLGRHVTRRLEAREFEVIALTRDPERARALLPSRVRVEQWAVGQPGPLASILSGVDAVLNLAGEPVARRWWPGVKKRIRLSRVDGTRTIVEAMKAADSPPRVLVNASATGFYGHRREDEITEEEGAGSDFIASVCLHWERAAAEAEKLGARVVMVRVGVVLTPDGGALPRLIAPFRWRMGGRFGNGRQGFPWIHIEDAVGIFLYAMEHEDLSGPVNAAAPNPVSNREFMKALGRKLGHSSWLPVPRLVLRILVGRMSRMLTTGQRAVPDKAMDSGFLFRFPDLGWALQDLLGDAEQ
jgi:uncharacterized protein (TIGR01777 family)